MSGPDFHLPQRRVRRRRKHARSPVAESNRWLVPVMAAVFLASLAGFERLPRGATTEVPFMLSDARAVNDRLSARFGRCDASGGGNCVVDGDTFWFAGDKYRIADIDTPETHSARCAKEAALGDAATGRLHNWLNAGAFSLEDAGREADHYGRRLRIVMRGGESVGALLVAEGLARPWEGQRRPWC